MQTRKTAIIGLLCVALLQLACNLVPDAARASAEQKIAAVELTFSAAVDAGNIYFMLPRCIDGGARPCSEQQIVDRIYAAELKTLYVLTAAEKVIRATDTPPALQTVALDNAARAVADLRELIPDH